MPKKETREKQAFFLPCAVQEALLSQSWDNSRDVMVRPEEDLQLNQASLENPEPSEEQALALPCAVQEALLSQSWDDSRDVMVRLQEDLQQVFLALENPEPGEEQALALPSAVQAALLSQSSDAKDVVARLEEDLQLKQVSLKNPEQETKEMIRCLARQAKHSGRLDVVKHLREVTPAGTTGTSCSSSYNRWQSLSVLHLCVNHVISAT